MRYIIIALALAQPLAALPLLNGSFELPALTNTQNLAGPFTIPGWTGLAPSNGGNAGLVVGTDNGLSPADGAQHFTFNGGNPSDQGYLEQTIPTTPGAHYALTYALGRAGGGQELSLRAAVFNAEVPLANYEDQPPAERTYGYHTHEFTALGALTTLRFSDTSGPNSISDLYIDAISITQTAAAAAPVPDTGPGAASLIALGLLILAARQRHA